MKQVFLSGNGQVEVHDVPVAGRLPGAILVRNAYSLISAGTEGAAVSTKSGWWATYDKLKSSQDRIQQVWQHARTSGLRSTWQLVRSKLESHSAPGYSCAGRVVELDDPRLPFEPGQPVACMGVGFASHAEYVTVPKNLAVPIPDGVRFEAAAFGALACVALQGIRRLELTPGERVGVIGLGLIGQIAVRLLAAMGYEALGMDLDARRSGLAGQVTGVTAWSNRDADSVRLVRERTEGLGLDGVLVCAATRSSDPLRLACDLCRPRGRVVVVGDVGLELERARLYRKEIEVRMSCSYGPGRYDEAYELAGHDYPLPHARWTERRNLEYFLSLLAAGRVDLEPLISGVVPVREARQAYTRIKDPQATVFGVLLDYDLPQRVAPPAPAGRTVQVASRGVPRAPGPGPIRLGLIGAGGYAKAMHLPRLRELAGDFRLAGIASRSGASAALVARREGADYATSDARVLLDDADIDAVLICTRHAEHAALTLEALRAGKHVFVEKPLATCVEDAERIVRLAAETGCIVRVGFNRRFAPALRRMRDAVGTAGRRMLQVRVNVGDVTQHWSNSAREGGRLLGEGVHFLDLCNWFLGGEPVDVHARLCGPRHTANPNASFCLEYADGSLATVIYTALGCPGTSKELYEAFGNGRTVRCDDFQSLQVFGTRAARLPRRERGDKGQRGVLAEFADAVRGRGRDGADARAGWMATHLALAAHEAPPRAAGSAA